MWCDTKRRTGPRRAGCVPRLSAEHARANRAGRRRRQATQGPSPYFARVPNTAATRIKPVASATFHVKARPVVSSSNSVDSSGVR